MGSGCFLAVELNTNEETGLGYYGKYEELWKCQARVWQWFQGYWRNSFSFPFFPPSSYQDFCTLMLIMNNQGVLHSRGLQSSGTHRQADQYPGKPMTNSHNKVRQRAAEKGQSSQEASCIQNRTPLFVLGSIASCVALGKLVNLSASHVFHLSVGDNNSTPQKWVWGLNEKCMQSTVNCAQHIVSGHKWY